MGRIADAAVRLTQELDPQDQALLELLGRLKAAGYRFITPTPATHRLVRRRRPAHDEDFLRDIFGWSRTFLFGQLDSEVLSLIRAAGVIRERHGELRATIRVSTVGDRLYVHSAPTDDQDAVFLGPDTYRFVRFLRATLAERADFQTALDIGTGAGVGALNVADLAPTAEVWGSDINPLAMRFARINALHAGRPLRLVEASGLPARPERFDLVVANPPYIAGSGGRTYRDGGDELGARLALDWVEAALPRLNPGGRFLLYTGSAIVAGRDGQHDALRRLAEAAGASMTYEELDPDVFGETLNQGAYCEAERIAAVGAVITAP